MSRLLIRSLLWSLWVGLLMWRPAILSPDATAQEAAVRNGDEKATPDTAAKPVIFTTQQDHQNMLQQLGVVKLRPGRNGNAEAENGANYDEANANPYPHLPDVMKLASGEPVSTPEQWQERRAEMVELLEREVYGRVPANVPAVKWEVRETREIEAGGKPAIQKHLVGVVDNSACPEIQVNVSMSLTLPKDANGPVPVLMSFGWTPFEPNPFRFGGRGGQGGARGGPRPPSKEDKLIAAGWGCATINPTTVQDDSGGFQRNPFVRNADPNAEVKPVGAGLTRGVIGLTNLGQPRKPDDWGALRAWGWGASRALDYLETEPAVDAKRVGIAGVSRYGKAALVAMAFDQRFAMGLIASSGAGGTKLFRRNFGESLENLAGSGEYHWMAGNYLKYSAEESTFGRRTADDLPVDSHMTLALCAPRLTFISHGVPEKGDANWLDHQGSFMAAIAAQPVFRLLGAKDLGRSDDYNAEKMPEVNVGLLDGELAWRQHDGGHTDEPNVEHFIRWADGQFAKAELPKSPDPVPSETPRLVVKRCDDFTVNGKGDSQAWNAAEWTSLVRRPSGKHDYVARFKIMYSDTGLYVLFDGSDKILTATMQEDFLDLWKEDVFECFFWPDERDPVYFEYEISPLGHELPILIPNLGGQFLGWKPWRYEGDRKIQKQVSATGGENTSLARVTNLSAEVFIPYELLKPLRNSPPKPGTKWRANFYRVDYDDKQVTEWDWARVGPSFHDFKNFGTLVFE